MRTSRQRLAAMTLLGGLTTLGIGLGAGPASAAVSDCQSYLGSAQSGSLHVTSTPAAGSDVPVGSTVSLQGSWNDGDFIETDRFYVCTTIDGVFNEAASSQDKGVGNNGAYSAAAGVPADAPIGSNVCFLGALKGQFEGRITGEMVSETLCFRAAAVATTTTTTTTTMAPVVDVPVVEAGTTTAPLVEAAPAVEPAPLPELPRTGSGVELLAGIGALSVTAGGLARFFGRRRPADG
jgi:LPXTG-motif cell wall-anchored protein